MCDIIAYNVAAVLTNKLMGLAFVISLNLTHRSKAKHTQKTQQSEHKSQDIWQRTKEKFLNECHPLTLCPFSATLTIAVDTG